MAGTVRHQLVFIRQTLITTGLAMLGRRRLLMALSGHANRGSSSRLLSFHPRRRLCRRPPDPILDTWNATKNTGSVSVLEAFVGKYPDSFYSELAKARIEELKRQQQMASLEPSAPQAPKTDPSLDAWNVAKTSDSRSVLQAFIDTYPMSFYAEVASGKIEDLKRKQQQAMVKDIQQALKDIRCYGGTIDGVWSGSSRQALDRFSQLAKLSPAPAE